MASVRMASIKGVPADKAGRTGGCRSERARQRKPDGEALARTATSAVGGAILGAAIGGGPGAAIGGALSVAAIHAARRLDRRNAARDNG